MMNQNAKKWVEALRSGEYSQGKGALHPSDSFCCLGVACDLYQSETGNLDVEKSSKIVAYDGEDSYLPGSVVKWLGLENPEAIYKGGSLASDNDIGKSFDQIADIIESDPEGLFDN